MNPTLEEIGEQGACDEGYLFYKEAGCDPLSLVDEHPDWYLWLAGHCKGDWVDDRLLDHCAERCPVEAMVQCASLLERERLDRCASQRPGVAMKRCASLLGRWRLDWCATQCPDTAIVWCDSLLSKERLDWCKERRYT